MAIDKSKLTGVEKVYPLNVSPYEQYMGDFQNPSVVSKINTMIQSLHQIGRLTNETVSQWNSVMRWIVEGGMDEIAETVTNEKVSVALEEVMRMLDVSLDNGLKDLAENVTNKKIDEMLESGQFETMIQTSLVEINEVVENKLDGFSLHLAEKVGGERKATMDDLGQDVKEAFTGGSVAVVGTGAVGTVNVQSKAITAEKTNFAFHNKSVNVFSNENLSSGYLDAGLVTASSSFSTTKLIPAKEGDVVRFPYVPTLGNNNRAFFYLADGTYLDRKIAVLSSDSRHMTSEPAPEGTAWVRVTLDNARLDSVMITINNSYPANYVAFYDYKTLDEGFVFNATQTNEVKRLVSEEVPINDNVLAEKIVALNGDSIAFGEGYAGGYGKIIAERNNMIYQNVAVSGGTITAETYKASGAARHWVSRTIEQMTLLIQQEKLIQLVLLTRPQQTHKMLLQKVRKLMITLNVNCLPIHQTHVWELPFQMVKVLLNMLQKSMKKQRTIKRIPLTSQM